MRLSISSTDDNKSVEMLYDIADEGKEKKIDISKRLFYLIVTNEI